MEKRVLFLRRRFASDYLFNFFLATVSSILFWRFYLHMMGYPQIAFGGDIHIAHALFGGFLMLGAMIVTLMYVGSLPALITSFAGGMGFGLFLDEIGKYISKNNDYFFQPAAMLIYLILVLLFYMYKYVRKSTAYSQAELRISDAVEAAEGVVSPGVFFIPRKNLHALYMKIVRHEWFQRVVLYLLIAYFCLMSAQVVRLCIAFILYLATSGENTALFPFARTGDSFVFSLAAQFVSQILAATCIAIGFYTSRISRRRAYGWYIRAMYIWIFVTQVFIFFHDQFSSVIYLAISLCMYITLVFMRDEERKREQQLKG